MNNLPGGDRQPEYEVVWRPEKDVSDRISGVFYT